MQEAEDRTYIAIDLKSFYASVECRERGLDPLDTNLVVADRERSGKTICLAVSPSLKAYGLPGRCRLFEVDEKIRDINAARKRQLHNNGFTGKSYSAAALRTSASLEVDYISAVPRMALYIDYSTRIYRTYLKYIAPEDIHVYSIDEVFMDVTGYLSIYHMTAEELARKMILEVMEKTGITATAGIGTNLYLAKIAMDIMAKHAEADSNGVRVAFLDEMTYRKKLWDHQPLTDFWRVGRGYAAKLAEKRIFTMGDIALCSAGNDDEYYNEDLLYRLFGINAELLIDHAWGWEPCTMKDIKAYRPSARSLGSGQVLHSPYPYEKALLVMKEMADQLSLDLAGKHLVTDQITITVGYDIENLRDPALRKGYSGDIKTDHYGRSVPKHAQGTYRLDSYTSSSSAIMSAAAALFERIVNHDLLVRRMSISAENTEAENSVTATYSMQDLFSEEDPEEKEQKEKERKLQSATLSIRQKFGKNSLLRGMDFEEGATARERNRQIGGHKA